jgi:CRP-like cAMP-binding protein
MSCKFCVEYLYRQLQKSKLFKDLSEDNIQNLLSNIPYQLKSYSKEEVVAFEGDDCSQLGMVLEGALEVKKLYPSGKIVTVSELLLGNTFGEAVIFSKAHKYPATIIVKEKAQVIYIKNEDIIKLCGENGDFLKAFLALLSEKILVLNKKVSNLAMESIRQKLASFVMEEANKAKSMTIKLPMSKKDLAEYMGIQRPSLSRELIKMREEGLIDFSKDKIMIKDLESLKTYLM